MSEDKAPYGGPVHPEPSKTEFDIGFDAQDPEVMLISVPVGEFSRDMKNGMAMFYGKMREAEAVGGKIIKEKRMKAKTNGILRMPGSVPPVVN